VIPGTPAQARWVRAEPRRTVAAALLERIVHTAVPGSRVLESQPLTAGSRNTNLKLRLVTVPEPVVLRIYEHDASICRKEADIMRLVGGSVPVPEILHVQADGCGEIPPFTLTRYVEGVSFRELKQSGDLDAISQAAFSAGETLAAIGCFKFPKAGWLAPGPSVAAPLLEGADPVPRFIEQCLSSATVERRMPSALRRRTREFAWSWAARLADRNQDAHLVHGDFGKRNLLVRSIGGRWRVVAVLDWEFAVAGSPLCDIANFLRYEKPASPLAEPHFSAGFQQAGGSLPPDWRALSRALDLTALCEILTHDALPDSVISEIMELVRATVEGCDTAGFGTAAEMAR
jgi:aminoglycoside phosphotransferase (APT) family kinase protein